MAAALLAGRVRDCLRGGLVPRVPVGRWLSLHIEGTGSLYSARGCVRHRCHAGTTGHGPTRKGAWFGRLGRFGRSLSNVADAHGSSEWPYGVTLVTADARGAGTMANVFVELHGHEVSSGKLEIPTLEFLRDSIEECVVTSPRDIGELQFITVSHDDTGEGSGWLLERIAVHDRHSDTHFHFACNCWLGRSDSGGSSGPTSLQLSPSLVISPGDEIGGELSGTQPGAVADSSGGSGLAGVGGDGGDGGGGDGGTGGDVFVPATGVTIGDSLTASAQAASAAALVSVMHDEPLTLRHSAMALPVPAPRGQQQRKGRCARQHGHAGDDAYVVDVSKGACLVGVADGVGHWRHKGIESGQFSVGLLNAAWEAFLDHHSSGNDDDTHSNAAVDASDLLAVAFEQVRQQGVQGSSTACLLTLESSTGLLRAANIGDSGFMVVRDVYREAEVVFRSVQQEHYFGYPFQLGHHSSSDCPSEALTTNVSVLPGDLIVVGTDGLFDNVTERGIIDTLLAEKSPWTAAARVAESAFWASMEKTSDTPYSLTATEEYGMPFYGGKRDDITVVIAEVVTADHIDIADKGTRQRQRQRQQ
eukprot:m.492497 g.492497  ORF g.492497 m.492497 type:complete len:587 (-) comp32888_c0_seq1:25-1785(-)